MRRKDPPPPIRANVEVFPVEHSQPGRPALPCGVPGLMVECFTWNMNPAGRTQPCSTWNIESEEGGLAALSLTARKRRRYGGQDVDRREKADRGV